VARVPRPERGRGRGLEHLDALDDGELRDRPIILAAEPQLGVGRVGRLPVGALESPALRRRGTYSCVLAAPENIPTLPLKWLVAALGAIPVDRERGIEQEALQDTVRLINARARA